MINEEEKIYLSVVVPVYNEKDNVVPLYRSIKRVLENIERPYEIVFVDDGSSDGTAERLRKLAAQDLWFRVIIFRRNFGQSAALAAGFERSSGEIVITMDGDLQNDPEDIPDMLKKFDQGYDVVVGWRKDRKDKFLVRKLPSRLANRLICSVTDVKLHDTGCALKAFRREVIDGIKLYGELHRFIPALARVEGARITEIVVHHHPRRHGKSKYNLTRTFRVLMDLSSLNIFLKYLRRPLQFFGKIGLGFLISGLVLAFFIGYRMFVDSVELIDLNVLVTLLFLLCVAGFQFLFIGLVGSLIVRTGDRRGGTMKPFVIHKDGGGNEK